MIIIGPILFGLIIGLVIGSRIRTDAKVNIGLTGGSILLLFIVAILMAWQLGNFPYYSDFPVATGFVSAFIGLILGKFLFGRSKENS
ncbi:energy-converting hydrogenase B subunit J [Methanobrevibacter acididurans]|uniref:energy-converting hydrogenase B subunit J n=1 Tax=Methanobrevibacter acididurans TaxID=120963 RepID=UPI0038FC3E82